MTQRIMGIVGFKNAGKTTLVERLVRRLTGLGYRISTIKHAHHGFDIDQEGRDSWRHREAGASEVAIVSSARWALVHELRGAGEPSLGEIAAKLEPADLIITEGYKWERHPKIEVRNTALGHPILAGEDASVVAIAATDTVAEAPVPQFHRDDIAAIAEFIIAHAKLPRR